MNESKGTTAQLKIGYVVSRYPSLSETFILNEILGLEERGADVTVFPLAPSSDPKFNFELSRVRGDVRYLPWFDSGRDVVKAFKIARGMGFSDDVFESIFSFTESLPADRTARVLINSLHLAQWVTELGIEHVHAHFMRDTASCAYLLKLMTGVPFTVTAHAFDIYREPIDEAWYRRIYSAVEALVTVCDSSRQYVADHLLGGDGSRVVRIYNGLPLEQMRPGSPPLGNRLVLGIGRLVEKKGWPVLLEACSIMKKNGIDFQCVLAGEGEQKDSLIVLRSELGLEDAVQLRGGLKREEVLRLMASASVFAAPCITAFHGDRDALPTVILEALALGLPVVSTRLSGIPEIIDDGVEGLLVEEGDAEALATALTRILDDEKLRRAMARAGPAKVADRFDREKTLPQLESLFRRSIQSLPAIAAGD